MKGAGVDKNLVPAMLRPQPAASDAGDGAARSWQREMERAQMEAWLSHAVIGFPGAARPAPLVLPVVATAAAATAVAAVSAAPAAAAAAPEIGPAPAAQANNAMPPVSSAGHGRPASVAGPVVESQGVPTHRRADKAPTDRRCAQETAVAPGPGPSASPGAADAQTQTARLASVLEKWGSVEATASIAGLPQTSPGVAAAPVLLPHTLPTATPAIPPRAETPGTQAREPFTPPPQRPGAMGHLQLPPSDRGAVGIVPPADGERVATPFPASASGRADAPATSGVVREASRGGRAPHAPAVEPIRLHADWSEEGVRLWLGMDPALAESLRAITAQLQRWLSAQGVRVLSISCNGRVVTRESETAAADIFETDTPAGEPPAASRPSHSNLKESS
jgi:hypothetical protein